jgi:hypothetical protein
VLCGAGRRQVALAMAMRLELLQYQASASASASGARPRPAALHRGSQTACYLTPLRCVPLLTW